MNPIQRFFCIHQLFRLVLQKTLEICKLLFCPFAFSIDFSIQFITAFSTEIFKFNRKKPSTGSNRFLCAFGIKLGKKERSSMCEKQVMAFMKILRSNKKAKTLFNN